MGVPRARQARGLQCRPEDGHSRRHGAGARCAPGSCDQREASMSIGRIVITAAAALALVAGAPQLGRRYRVRTGRWLGRDSMAVTSPPTRRARAGSSCRTPGPAARTQGRRSPGTRPGPQGATGPQGPAGPQGATGPPGSNTVYGRIIGVDFGTSFGYVGAPSGVSTASTGGDLLSEELSANSAFVLQNLQVQLVQPGSDAADPVPVPPPFVPPSR
jgi:hypothetical protein